MIASADRTFELFVEDGEGSTSRLVFPDLDSAERAARELIGKGRRVSVEVRENDILLYTLHL